MMKRALKIFLAAASLMLIFFSFGAYAAESEAVLSDKINSVSAFNNVGYMTISWEK